MKQLTIEPAEATLGAVVTGLHLGALDDATWSKIKESFDVYAVLIFPGQHLSDREQVEFAGRFGPVMNLTGTPGITPITNLTEDGRLRGANDPQLLTIRGNEGWHTDSSFASVSAKATILSAHIVPNQGGETEWVDMRAAYEALDDDLRRRVEHLTAYHSLTHSQSKLGARVPEGAYGATGGRPPLRPLVKIHKETGRAALFIGRHAYGIPGLSEEDSESLLNELLEMSCRPPRLLSHSWRVGDLAVWDNRCLLHRARPWDPEEPRLMKHTRIAGDPTSEAALPVDDEAYNSLVEWKGVTA